MSYPLPPTPDAWADLFAVVVLHALLFAVLWGAASTQRIPDHDDRPNEDYSDD